MLQVADVILDILYLTLRQMLIGDEARITHGTNSKRNKEKTEAMTDIFYIQ
jgi:hypothetical protein